MYIQPPAHSLAPWRAHREYLIVIDIDRWIDGYMDRWIDI